MIEFRTVEAACGECQFSMPGTGCDLAVRMDGQSYFVDGVGIDDHGDAHAHDGLCNVQYGRRVFPAKYARVDSWRRRSTCCRSAAGIPA